MQKEKHHQAKIYLIVGLGIVFCAVGYFRFFYDKSAATPARPAPTALPPPVVPAVNVQPQAPGAKESPGEEPRAGDMMRVVTRDIFEPGKSALAAMATARPAFAEKAAGHRETVAEIQLVLNGLIYSDNNRLAIINGTFHRVGDTIGGFKVVRIGESEVLLKGEDREITLRIVDNVQK